MKPINKSGSEHIYLCPFPGCDDESGHFYLNKIKGVYNCFKCGKSGKLSDIDDIIGQIDILPSLDEVSDALKYFVVGSSEQLELPEDYKTAHSKSRAALYLHGRGISQQKICKYSIGYTSQDGFRRIWFPDYDSNGNFIFYCTRRYWKKDEKQDRILRWKFPNAEKYGVWKSSQLYHYALAKSHKRVYVVEGITSAIAVGDNAIGTYGTHYSKIQVCMIADLPCEEVYIMFDGDILTPDQRKKGVKKGREKGKELADELAGMGKRTYLVHLPDGCDPASAGKKRMQDAIDNAELIEVSDIDMLSLNSMSNTGKIDG